jgi:hypothetical protein
MAADDADMSVNGVTTPKYRVVKEALCTPKTEIGETASQFFPYYYLNTINITAPTVYEIFFAFFTTSVEETITLRFCKLRIYISLLHV